jgi:DNA-binding IscR family transcriptional regulator
MPRLITVAEIITSVDEPIDATQCGGKQNCLGQGSRCMTHDLWASLNSAYGGVSELGHAAKAGR